MTRLCAGNAAWFFASDDKPRALALLERARALEPDEPQWSRRIAQQIGIGREPGESAEARRARAQRVHAELERAAAHAALGDDEPHLPHRSQREGDVERTRLGELPYLPELAWAALGAGEIQRAEDIANDLLQAPAWFAGVFHEARLILGNVALRRGDATTATAHLRAAAAEQFPFWAARGKRIGLVRALYDAGERDAVVDYLEAELRSFENLQALDRTGNHATLDLFSQRTRACLDSLRAGRRPNF